MHSQTFTLTVNVIHQSNQTMGIYDYKLQTFPLQKHGVKADLGWMMSVSAAELFPVVTKNH